MQCLVYSLHDHHAHQMGKQINMHQACNCYFKETLPTTETYHKYYLHQGQVLHLCPIKESYEIMLSFLAVRDLVRCPLGQFSCTVIVSCIKCLNVHILKKHTSSK